MSIAYAWDLAFLRFYVWRHRSTVAKKIALCFAAAAFTGAAAQMRVPLSFTPVPVTGQVFAVLLSGVFLGRRYGALSQIIYVALGAAGVPWFAGWTSGAVLGVTGGYLVGFIPAAALVGWFSDRRIGARTLAAQTGLMMLAVGVILTCGAVQYFIVMRTGLSDTLIKAVLPFILVDLAKAIAAAAIGAAALPSVRFGPESSGPDPSQ